MDATTPEPPPAKPDTNRRTASLSAARLHGNEPKPGSIVACPHCRAAIKLPAESLGQVQRCGGCGGLSMQFKLGGRLVPLERQATTDITTMTLGTYQQGDDLVMTGQAVGRLQLPGTEWAGNIVLRQCRLGRLDLAGATISGDLICEDVFIAEDADLSGLTVRHVDWRDNHVAGALLLRSAHVLGDCQIWNTGVDRDLDLSQTQFDGVGRFRKGVVGGEASAVEARFGDEFNISYTTFRHGLDVTAAECGSGLEAFQSRHLGVFQAAGLSVKGWADWTQSRFEATANFTGVAFDAGVEFGSCHFAEAIFTDADFAGEVLFTQSVMAGPCRLDRAHILGDLDVRGVVFQAEVDAVDATFGAGVYAQESRYEQLLQASGVHFTGPTSFDRATFLAGLDWEGGIADADVTFRAARFAPRGNGGGVTHTINMAGMLFGRHLDLETARVDANLDLRKAYLYGSVRLAGSELRQAVTLESATVNGFVELTNAQCHGKVDFSSSKIGAGVKAEKVRTHDAWNWAGAHVCGGDTTFADGDFQGKNEFNGATFGGRLCLRNASFTEKLDLKNISLKGTLEIDGLRADHLQLDWEDWRNSLAQKKPRLTSEQEASFSRSNSFLRRLLGLPNPQYKDNGKAYGTAADEYRLLRRACQSSNDHEGADWAHYRTQVCRRRFKTWQLHQNASNAAARFWKMLWVPLRQFPERAFLDWGSGYGTRPWRALLSLFVAGLLFVPIYWAFPSLFVVADGAGLGLDEAILFSYSTLLTFGLENLYPTLQSGLIKYVALLEAFFGIALVTMFVSTLSRKVIQ